MPSLTKIQTGFLEPQGAFELDPGTASSPGLFFSGNTSTGMFSPSAGVLGFSTGSTQQALTILANGEVGIGTTNPSLRLDVRTTSSADVVIFKGNTAGTLLTIDNNTLDDYKIGGVNTVAPLVVYNNTDARYEMVFDGSGNVGIGTTQPSSRLTSIDNIEARDTSGWRGIKIENTGSPQSIIKSINYLGAGYEAQLRFQTMTGTTTTDAMSIVGSGNVGVGTTDPATKFHVFGDWASGQGILKIDTTGNFTGLTAHKSGSTKFAFYNDNSNTLTTIESADALRFFVSSAERLRITSDGNVNIDSGRLYIDAVNDIVAIGSSTPNIYGSNGLLVNNGTLTINQDGANEPVLQFRSGTAAEYGRIQYPPAGIRFTNVSGNAETLRITSDGNVGIGTTDPNSALSIMTNKDYSTDGVEFDNYASLYLVNNYGGGAYTYSESVIVLAGRNSQGSTHRNSITGGGSGISFFTTQNTDLLDTPDLRITRTGNVGIGTTNPTAKLHVYSTDTTGQIKIGGGNGSGNHRVYINSDPTSSYLDSFGNGAYASFKIEATPLLLNSSSGGNVGIGTTNPSLGKLDVRLSSTSSFPDIARFANTDDSNASRAFISLSSTYQDDHEGVVRIGSERETTSNRSSIIFYTSNTASTSSEKMRIRANGNVGIGSTNPQYNLDVTGNFRVSDHIINRSYTFTETIYNSAAQRKIVCRVNGTYSGSCVRVTVSGTTGNVVINGWWDIIVNHSNDIGIVSYGGNYTPVYLRVTSGGSDSYDIDLYRTGNTQFNDTPVRITVTCFGMETVTPTNTGSYSGVQLEASAFSGMRIWGNNDGSAGGDPGDLTVNGNLSKGSGTFKIDHPLPSKKDTHYLVHSFTESPQADLIYRGTVELQNGTAQINIDESAGMTEGTFVVLCRNVQCYTTNESGWDLVKGSVSGNILTIESQNTSSTDTISWMVIGERQDPHIYRSSATGTDGRIIIEPSKDLP